MKKFVVLITTSSLIIFSLSCSTKEELGLDSILSNRTEVLVAEVGFGQTDITPNYPVPLGGYASRQGGLFGRDKLSTGVNDRVCARAVAFRGNNEIIALVSLDICIVTSDLRKSVYKAIPKELGLKAERFLVAATHTHNGPGCIVKPIGPGALIFGSFLMGKFNKTYYEFLIERAATAVIKAIHNLKPSKIGWNKVETFKLSKNRGLAGGPIDPEINVCKVTDSEEKIQGAFIAFAVHGTCISENDMKVSGDIGGEICRTFEKLNPGAICIYWNGAEGDLRPASLGGLEGYERAKAVGESIAKLASDALQKIRVHHKLPVVMYEWRALTPEVKPEFLLIKPDSLVFQGIAFGKEAVLLTVPGEMCVGIGIKVKSIARKIGFTNVVFIGLANDYFCYFVAKEAFQPEYAKDWKYEKLASPFADRAEDFLLNQYVNGLKILAVHEVKDAKKRLAELRGPRAS